jgi:HEPN domain-containing protein
MTPRSEAWIRQATSDLKAGRCMESEGFHAQACYLAGQAAEKALKALVVAIGITPPHSHALERLVEVLEQHDLDTAAIRSLRLKPLSRMSSETRYPHGDEAPIDLFDANDSKEALTTAEAVVQIAAAHLAG